MLSIQELLVRFVVALVLGGILGVERELVGKEAGVRTEMLVAGGASMFTMIGLLLPYIAATMSGATIDLAAQTSSFSIIANIVVGIGFLGAGLIVKMNDHPHGVTTAALVWATAAIGVLAGIGMATFATFATVLIVILLFILRKMNISKNIEEQARLLNFNPVRGRAHNKRKNR
jgi:putative Mg2+ transporter-C (MgtC) family protein